MVDTTTRTTSGATTHGASRDVDITPRRSDGMSVVYGIALALVIIGGLNWGLIGLFDFNLVAAIFGEGSALSRIVYILVGISALLSLGCYSRLRRNH